MVRRQTACSAPMWCVVAFMGSALAAPDCSEYARLGYCTQPKMRQYMEKHCASSCQAGGGTVGAEEDEQCSGWAAEGYCTHDQFKDYMERSCPNSCGFEVQQTPSETNPYTLSITGPVSSVSVTIICLVVESRPTTRSHEPPTWAPEMLAGKVHSTPRLRLGMKTMMRRKRRRRRRRRRAPQDPQRRRADHRLEVRRRPLPSPQTAPRGLVRAFATRAHTLITCLRTAHVRARLWTLAVPTRRPTSRTRIGARNGLCRGFAMKGHRM